MKYYNGLNDIVFKNTLCVEEHKGLLKWLLESCLDIKIDNLILKDKELSKKAKYSKGRVVDLLIESKNIQTDNFIIYEINVDLLKKLYYNKDIKSINKYKPVIMLTLNKEELEEFSLGDERIMEYKDKENELNSDDDFVTFISREEDQEKTENALRTIISEKNEELKNSREELKTQKTKLNIEHAKKLKENKVDVKIISDTTGLTIEEIEKL